MPRKSDKSDILFDALENELSRFIGFHEEGHRAGVLVGDAAANEARTNNIYLDALRREISTQGEAPSFHARLGRRITRTRLERTVSRDRRGKDNLLRLSFDCREDGVDASLYIDGECVAHVLLGFLARRNPSVREDEIYGMLGAYLANPRGGSFRVRNIEDDPLGVAAFGDGLKSRLIASAKKEFVSALRRRVSERFTDTRTCTCNQSCHIAIIA